MAVDEIFQGDKPTLVMVDPRSMAILRAEVKENRSAQSWKQMFEGCKSLQEVAADRAKGIEQAVHQAGYLKQDDLFHAYKVLSDVFGRWEGHCLRLIREEYRLEEKLKRKPTMELQEAYERKRQEVCELLGRFDQAEGCIGWVRELLEVTDRTGQWIASETREEMLREILARWKRLGMPQQQRVRGYLSSPNLLTFARKVEEAMDLVDVEIPGLSTSQIRRAIVRVWARSRGPLRGDGPVQVLQDLLVLRAVPQGHPDGQAAIDVIHEALDRVIRASSAVEAINSLLRPIQQIKKTFPTSFAYLVALYHNMRPFSEGVRKGKTPFEILGISVLFKDWIELIRRVA